MNYYLTVDIGGTNTTIGLFSITHTDGFDETINYHLEDHIAYKSREEQGIIPSLEKGIAYFKKKYQLQEIPPINISACGPVHENTCQPTNLPAPLWLIDKNKIENHFNTKVLLINDFAGVAYGLMTLCDGDTKIQHIAPSPQTNFSSQEQLIKVVLGAGTGLGCATLQSEQAHSSLITSEAGWLDFAPDVDNDNEIAFMYFLAGKSPSGEKRLDFRTPTTSWEDAICASRGITFIYDFFSNKEYSRNIVSDEERAQLKTLDVRGERDLIPVKISTLAKDGNSGAQKLLSFWITLYARYSKQIALTSLPNGGVFLGGGAAAKNTEFFLKDDLFYKVFTTHNNPEIKKLLLQIPLYFITDYHISLYGNAYHIYTK